MKRLTFLFAMALFSVLCIPEYTSAQVPGNPPEGFIYQAEARNSGGDIAANKDLEVTINIIQGSADNSALYTEIHSVTTNEYGIFTLIVGNGDKISTGVDFSLIPWGDYQYFLNVKIQDSKDKKDREIDMGTVQLLSVPYAFQSDDANNALHANNADDALHANDADNAIHANNADDALRANNALHAINANNAIRSSNADEALHSNNADNGFTSEFSETDNRPMFNNTSGNVSVGTNINWSKLNVNGWLHILPGDCTWGSAIFLNAEPLNGGHDFVISSLSEGSAEGAGRFFIYGNDYKSTFMMDEDGNVGIGLGQESPNYKLDIAGDINFSGGLYKNGALFSTDYNTLANKPDLSDILNTGNNGGEQQIKNIAIPTEAKDVATKEYVDQLLNRIETLEDIIVSLAPNIDVDGDGFTSNDGDCDDSNPLINPAAEEDCDGIDNNCDGVIDEICGCEEGFYYSTTSEECEPCDASCYTCDPITGGCLTCGEGYWLSGTPGEEGTRCVSDCTPGVKDSPSTNLYARCLNQCPDGYWAPPNGVCSPQIDNDGDGYFSRSTGGDDCNDSDPNINPGAEEVCDDDIDNDCDGLGDGDDPDCGTPSSCAECLVDNDCGSNSHCIDLDGSKYCANECIDGTCPEGFTCTEIEPSVTVCVPISGSCDCLTGDAGNTRPCEITNEYGTCTGVETCDPVQGWTGCTATTPEPEIWYDGIDQNCDGMNDFDQDGDGYVHEDYSGMAGGSAPNTGDCDDNNPTVYPGATEILNDGIDQDCDGVDKISETFELDSDDPLDAAKTMGIYEGLVSAEWVKPDGSNWSYAESEKSKIGHGNLSSFGPNVSPLEGSQLLVLSTGTARIPGDPDYLSDLDRGIYLSPPLGFPLNFQGCLPTGPGANDGIALQVTLQVPENATGFKFNSKFYSKEFPEYVCGVYNDQAVAIVNPDPPGSISGNVLFDVNGNPLMVGDGSNLTCCNSDTGYPCIFRNKRINGNRF